MSNRYYVYMDGQQMPQTYTWDELRQLGVFMFDDVYIRATNESEWQTAKTYHAVSTPNSNFNIDEFGQIRMSNPSANSPSTTPSSQQPNYTIDEYGQIVSSSMPSSNRTTPASSNSGHTNKNSGWVIFIQILASIIVIGVAIVIIGLSRGIAAPLGLVVWKALKGIWSHSD